MKHTLKGSGGNLLLWAWGGGLHSEVEGRPSGARIDPPEGVAKFKGVLLLDSTTHNRQIPPVSSYGPNLGLLSTLCAGAKWGVVW
jgi:hypothetical protein